MKKHVLVIAQYFYPEQFRINDICTEWVKRGYKVTVLTGIPNYPQGKFYEDYGILKRRKENYEGIEIIRIPIIPRGNSALMLILNYISFVVSGFFWSMFTKLKADSVFIFEVSPMTQALPGVWYANKNKIPCYLYVTDLWPENVEIAAGIKNEKVIKVIGIMVDYIYKRCNRIFTSSESFIQAIVNRGIDKNKLEFWPQYAESYYKPLNKLELNIKEIPNDGIFNIIFAGNIGTSQGLHILPKTAIMLKEKSVKVRFNIVGEGRFKQTLKNEISKYKVSEFFNFIDKQSPTKIPEMMAVSDATLISLSKSEVFSITLPSKTQSCLACGIPILVSADGEVQRVIEESASGLYSDAEDAIGLSENIIKIINFSNENMNQMGKNAISYNKEFYDKEKLLNKMDEWLSK